MADTREQTGNIEALLESQALLSSLIESTDAMIWAVDSQDFSLILYNSALRDFYRHKLGQELRVGMSLEEFTHGKVKEIWTKHYGRALAQGHFSAEYLTSDGSLTLLLTLGVLRREGEVFGISIFGKNITHLKAIEEEQRRMEARLAHGAKMESLGALSAGIAHDMNNVLGAVQAVAETLKFKYPADAFLQQALGTLMHANDRGRNLVKGLTSFSRKDLHKAEAVDLNQLIREETEILSHTTFRKVSLVLDLEQDLPCVLGDRSALTSALMNLCVNALDAMAGSGTLTLRTRTSGGGWLELCVADDGEGMSPETLARATEPFYTTKPVGKGTGLGLAMVHATAKTHGGSVEILSVLGQGTQVLLHLPGIRPQAVQPMVPAPVHADRGLRILLVDDDEIILDSVPGMLENSGHVVLKAASGREAMLLIEAGVPVDVVIVDLNMPGMDGFEVLTAVRSIRPALPLLLATGSQDATVEERTRQMPSTACIRKPFSMDEIAEKLRALV